MDNYGLAHKLGNNISTDDIIAVKRKRDSLDMEKLTKYLFEDIDSFLRSKIKQGDYIVAGWNFGCGSSREAAPLVILNSGVKAVIAKSFARIFYRNAISIGLTLFECNTDDINDGDKIRLDLKSGKLLNVSKNRTYVGKPLPTFMLNILNSGGLISYLEGRDDFSL